MFSIYYQMSIEIPKSFQLLGHTYKVEVSEKLYENEDAYGDCDVEKKLIRIQKIGPVNRIDKKTGKLLDTVNITEEDFVETFFHELTHVILYNMGEDKLFADEKFVGLMGRCFMEALKNFKIENIEEK